MICAVLLKLRLGVGHTNNLNITFNANWLKMADRLVAASKHDLVINNRRTTAGEL